MRICFRTMFSRYRGSRFLLGWTFLTVAGIFYCLPQVFTHEKVSRKLLIVSFDGFRWDYLNRTNTPVFDDMISRGVHATRGLKNIFTTSTLTNHFSIVTGLYAESHSIIDNKMYDPVINSTYVPLYVNKSAINDPRFYDTGVEPIWVTNQIQNENGRSGSIMWWGAENVIKGTRPTYHMPFDLHVDYKARINTMVQWLSSGPYPINLGLMYFSEPDHTAHATGPDSENVTRLIEYADHLTGYLLEQLKKVNLLDNMNIIITSDHGFASVSKTRLINLDDFVDPSLYTIVNYSPVATIIPNEGQEDFVYEKLKSHSENNHFKVYKKADIPERLHYKYNIRVTPIIAIADLTYSFISRFPVENFTLAGNHGYDNEYQEMRPFFIAMGPDFKSNFKVETFSLVDIYPLMCQLLGLEPAPNNGSRQTVSLLLREDHDEGVWTFETYVLCFAVVGSTGFIFSITACRYMICSKKSARQTQSHQYHGSSKQVVKGEVQVPLMNGTDEDDF